MFSVLLIVACAGIIVPTAKGNFCTNYPTVGECENQGLGQCMITVNSNNGTISDVDAMNVMDCSTCGDVFGDLNTDLCHDAPCDGLLCETSGTYRASFQGTMRCDKNNVLQPNCSDCDTACVEICDDDNIRDLKLVQCLFNLGYLGELEVDTGLCGGAIPQALCDLVNITCVVFRFTAAASFVLDSFDLDQSARIFIDRDDWWAMNKTSAMTTTFENFNIMHVYTTEFCNDFEALYGTTDLSSSSNSTNDGTSLEDAASRLLPGDNPYFSSLLV